jgi:D-glycero-D-manno-heptose 1,7-bisphosphate phosphatase
VTCNSPAQINLCDTDSGLWCETTSRDFTHRAALFLDRDGVIVDDSHYLGRAENVRMLKGSAEAIGRCNHLGIPVVVVSNQSGIARRLYDWRAFQAVQAAVTAALANVEARLDAVFACAHHVDGAAPLNIADHPWRKPNPGMIVAAGRKMQLDLSRSWIVGDRASDIAAGSAARLEGGILISTSADDSERPAAMKFKAAGFAVDTAASLEDAVLLLVSRGCLGAESRS